MDIYHLNLVLTKKEKEIKIKMSSYAFGRRRGTITPSLACRRALDLTFAVYVFTAKVEYIYREIESLIHSSIFELFQFG